MKQLYNTIAKEIRTRKQYKYSIRVETKPNGSTVFTPMVREPGLFSPWKRVTQVYDKYYLDHWTATDLVQLTYDQCIEHLEGFKKRINEEYILHAKPRVEYKEIDPSILQAMVDTMLCQSDIDKW